MGKLRHLAITAPDVEQAAGLYKRTFGMSRMWKGELGIMLSDGTVSLAILKFPTDALAGDERGKDFHGLHHFGFVVENLERAQQAIESNSGRYFSVDFSDTDHAAVARAFGIEAHRVTDPARLEGVLREAVSGPGPCLVDVVCQPLNEARAPVSEWIA